jgi:hypothetical protein
VTSWRRGRCDRCVPTHTYSGGSTSGLEAELNTLAPPLPFQGENRVGQGGPAGQQAQKVRGDNKQGPVSRDVRHSNELPRASFWDPGTVTTAAPGGRVQLAKSTQPCPSLLRDPSYWDQLGRPPGPGSQSPIRGTFT